MIHYCTILRALLVRLTVKGCGVGVDLYKDGLTLWWFWKRDGYAADFGNVG